MNPNWKYNERILQDSTSKQMLTPLIATICGGRLTQVDINQIVEEGSRIIRFQTGFFTREQTRKLITMIENASKYYCEKYSQLDWPVAVAIDIPNAIISTGLLDCTIEKEYVYIKTDAFVNITSNIKYWDKCNAELIFIDAYYTLQTIKPGDEIAVWTDIDLVCTEVIDMQNIRCKVVNGGYLRDSRMIFLRGKEYLRPRLGKKDLDLIAFAKEIKPEIVVIDMVRNETDILDVKNLLKPLVPLLLCTINEESGLNNIDDILELADGIVVCREFLFGNLRNHLRVPIVTRNIAAKCKAKGKPCFISGDVFGNTMRTGFHVEQDCRDSAVAILSGLGVLFRTYNEPEYLVSAISSIKQLCLYIEPMCDFDYWRVMGLMQIPVTAADACVVAAGLTTILAKAKAIIVPTVSGDTAKQLASLLPTVPIITVSSSSSVARRLLLYRGIVPLVYYDKGKNVGWADDMWNRVTYAVKFALKRDIVKFGQHYVVIKKSLPTSAFCDQVTVFQVGSSENDAMAKIICDE